MRSSGGGDHLTRLVTDLERLVALLHRHGEEHWSGWARRSLAELENRDARGLYRVRQAYGGMGSFNDLVLDGASPESRRQANTDLHALRERVFEDVTALLHDLANEVS